MNLPEVDQLRCFVAAAEALHFRRAAARVHLTPAALGKQVKRLEERVGQPLFVRTTRRVQLTAAGVQLLGRAQHALEALGACASLAPAPTPLSGEVVLGSRHELAVSWLMPALHALQARAPGLEPHLYIGSGSDLLARVRTGELDCAVTSSRLADPGLEFERLHDEAYVFVGSKVLLKRAPLKRPADAAAHVLFDTSLELPLYRYFRDAAPPELELEFGRLRCLGTIEIIRDEVLAGRGVAVLPEYFVGRDVESGALTTVFPKVAPQRDAFRLVFRKNDRRRELFQALAAELRAQPLV